MVTYHLVDSESTIEKRVDDGYCTMELLKKENARFRDGCERNGLSYIKVESNYEHSIKGIDL